MSAHHKNKEVKPVQMAIYQSNTYRKDISQPEVGHELRIQERQQAVSGQ